MLEHTDLHGLARGDRYLPLSDQQHAWPAHAEHTSNAVPLITLVNMRVLR